jgi:hypothetical protein
MAQGEDPVTHGNGGGRTHEIEREIDRTRAAMDRTVDAIAGKLTPQQLAFEALGVLKEGSSALAAKVVQTAREHPVPATIIGIGLGLLLAESARGEGADRGTDRHVGFGAAGAAADEAAGVRDRVAETAGHVKQQAAEGAAQVKEQAAQVKDQVREQAAHLKEQVAEKTTRVREQAAQVPVAARQQWHDAKLGFWQTMDQRPFAIGAAALAAGVAAGLSVAATRREQALMGETRDRLLGQAKDVTREAMDKGRQVARAAGHVVKSEVQRQGLAPAAIAEKVRAIGREAEQALKSEAERVAAEPLRATGQPPRGADDTLPGGAAGRGMTAGFASAAPSATDPTATQRVVTGTGTETDKTRA